MVGAPSAAVHHVEIVVLQGQRKVVGPELDQRRVLGHRQHRQDEQGDEGTINQHRQVTAAARFGRVGDGSRRQQRRLLSLHDPVDGEGDHRRQQQDHRDHRPHLEVLLADHLFVDVGGENVVVAADHLGHAEIGEHQGEDHEPGADQPVLDARQRHREEGPELARAQRLGRFVEPGVGDRQRGDHDHQGMGKHPVAGSDDDADRSVDALAHQQLLGHALIAEPVDQGDAAQQRGRQQRDQRHRPKEALERHAGAGQRVGVDEGAGEDDAGGDDGDRQAVVDGEKQRRGREVLGVVGQSDEIPGVVLQALRHHRVERQQHADHQENDDAEQTDPHDHVVATDLRLDLPTNRGGGGNGAIAHASSPG